MIKKILSKGNISLFVITMLISAFIGLTVALLSDDKVNIVAMTAISGVAVTLCIDYLGELVGMKLGCKEASAYGVMLGVILMLMIF